ncbi:MAG: phosphatidylglycerophosphatase A [Proteobacteria bacterium]|nr:phosphatidylglycerophosphatase A [Pseudomonadota bacterium]
MRHVIILLSTGLYSGFSPIAPGTAGTIVAVPLFLVLSRLPVISYVITVVAFFFFSSWLSGTAEAIFRQKDSQRIVIDEMFGFLLAMSFMPPAPLYVVVGFFLFRFFDIAKPFPARRLERLSGGYGVVADDLVAGVYTGLVLHIGVFLLQQKSLTLIFPKLS